MLARLEAEIPVGGGWVYEPKWDGFRGLIFKDATSVYISSRNAKSLHPYFPELVEAALRSLPEACVLDGEIVVAHEGRLDFQALLERLDARRSGPEARPAAPACFVAFDLLALGEVDLRPAGFGERRRQLEGAVEPQTDVVVTPQTDDPEVARGWLEDLADRGFEGIVAKQTCLPYRPGRRAMVKVKRWRSADLVVAGYLGPPGDPWSLLLGVYDGQGVLHHVGQTVPFSPRERAGLRARVAPLEGGRSFGGGLMPGRSRWEHQRFDSWVPLTPALVCEVAFTALDGRRLRHSARFIRWRPDKDPADCTYRELPPLQSS
jgi:ATP-dependent DNA ligase